MTWTGMNRTTGKVIDESEHISQSIKDILTTPIGTRVMRRPFGSLLFDLTDSPGTATGALRLVAAAADAIERWENRVVFVSGTVTVAGDGRATLTTKCRVRADGRPLEVPIPLGAAA